MILEAKRLIANVKAMVKWAKSNHVSDKAV